MRKTSSVLAFTWLCLGLLLLGGCVDVSEDITIRSDLSGRYLLRLSLSENLATVGDMVPGERSGGDPQRNFEELKARLEQEKFIESAEVTAVTEDEVRSYSIDIHARDMRRLGEYFAEQSQTDGDNPYRLSFKLERLSIGKFHFSRALQFSAMQGMGLPAGGNPCAGAADAPGAAGSGASADSGTSEKPPAAPESGESGGLKDRLLDQGRDMLDKGLDAGIEQGKRALGGLGGMLGGLVGEALLRDHYYTVTLRAPGLANTDAILIEGGKGAQWKIPMAELMNGDAAGRSLEADFTALGISGSMMLLLTLFAMLLFGGLIIGIAITGARRRRKAASQPRSE